MDMQRLCDPIWLWKARSVLNIGVVWGAPVLRPWVPASDWLIPIVLLLVFGDTVLQTVRILGPAIATWRGLQ